MELTVPEDAVLVVDVDDTLYLERDYVRSGFTAVGDHLHDVLGLEGVRDELWSGFEAGVRRNAFDRLLERRGIPHPAGLLDTLITLYRTHPPDIELLPDARRLLDRAADRAVAVITDGPASAQRAKLAALGIEDGCDPVIVTDELGPGHAKPDPLAYVMVEQRHGSTGERCWYVADNPAKDFRTPLARGWRCVRVRRIESLHHRVATPHGVVEIDSLDELQC